MKYSLSLRVVHWVMAALILGLITVGFYMSNIEADAPDKYELYPIHKSLGFIVLMLFFIRVVTRLKSHIPAPPEGLLNWEVRLSHFVHGLLYVSMISMAFSGYMMNSTYAYVEGLDMFGLFTVPDITEKSEYWNSIFHTVHEYTAYILVGSLVLHLAGVVKHKFMDASENDVLGRMV